MRILITGGAGYIGSHAVRLFLERGHDVWVYDSLALGHRKSVPAERLIVGDLNETHRIDQTLVEKRIEAVVHFAAWAAVGESVQNPAKYYQNNLVNTLNLMECLRHAGRHVCARLHSCGRPGRGPSAGAREFAAGTRYALQPWHRPWLQRSRSDPRGGGSDRQEGPDQGGPAACRRSGGARGVVGEDS